MNKHTALHSYLLAKEIQSFVGAGNFHKLSMDFETPQGQDGFHFGISPNSLLVRFILQRDTWKSLLILILPGQMV